MEAAGKGPRNPDTQPDLRWIVLTMTAGLLAVMAAPALPRAWMCVVIALPVLLRWRGRVFVAAAVLGILLATWHGRSYLVQRWPPSRHNQTLELRGDIVSLPSLEPAAFGGRVWRFDFAPDTTGSEDMPRRIRVSWYHAGSRPRAGECWALRLRLRTPHGSLNPGGSDYEGWLMRSGVGALGTVRDARRCKGAGGWHPVLRMRQRIAEQVRARAGPGVGTELLLALSIGDTSGLRDAQWRHFRLTGTTHLIAISGFNLAIVAAAAFFVLRWAWSLWPPACLRIPAQRVALYGSGAFATIYAMLAGFEPPVARALIMLLVLVAAARCNRLQQPSRALAVAWGMILIYEPFAILSPGMWLSFGAVAAIIYVSAGRYGREPGWRVAIRVQLFLSLALLPLSLYYFHGLSWVAPLVNLIAVPLFGVVTPLVFAALLLTGVSGAAGSVALGLCAGALRLIDQGLGWVAGHAPLAWLPASPPDAALLLAAIGAVIAFAPAGLPRRGLAAPCLVALLLPRPVQSHSLDITALDVGQGLAVVVRTAHHTLLVDAGPAHRGGFDAGRSVVAPYLLQAGVRRLDLLLLSHGDNDHAGGVPSVRRLVDVRAEIGTPHGAPCTDGRRWQWDGVQFELFHIDHGHASRNNRSCVLRIRGPFSALLPGDIERGAEQILVRRARSLRADVLLAPHHGSASSSSPAFVAAVHPALVVHSAGWRSRYGHPRPEVVARYAAIGAEQHDTGVEGAVEIWSDAGGRLREREWRQLAAHWWNAAATP